ncbi:unnamed protein product [Symbiodinium natans]|uniref:Uncharacterized protein n=1 Tax=Symbiodinium natans TaxID=878477 RepID=A0A812P7P0_9DINO|nr:unnamed protein product [Symbiodinium natans]
MPKGDLNQEIQGIETIWGGFTFVLGFLIVFRSNQAYNRFWESVTLLHQTTGEWTSAYSNLLAFCSEEPTKQKDVAEFQALLSKLMSLLHCSALQDLCELEDDTLEVLDLGGLSRQTLQHLRDSPDRAESVLLWIERLIMHADKSKILDAPAPILSRAFQELSRGMVTVSNMRKIRIPFPFPYSQHLACVLIFYTALTPVVASQAILRPLWAGIMVFVVCISYWTLYYIAQEIDQPFGDDANDLPIREMQHEFNAKLTFFIHPLSYNVPDFRPDASQHIHMLGSNFTLDLTDSHNVVLQPLEPAPVMDEVTAVKAERRFSEEPLAPASLMRPTENSRSPRSGSQVLWEPHVDPLNSAVLTELLPKVLPEEFELSDIRRILEAAGIDDKGDKGDRSGPQTRRTNTAASCRLSILSADAQEAYTASLTALSLRVEDMLSQRESALNDPALRRQMYRLKEALTEVLMEQCRV